MGKQISYSDLQDMLYTLKIISEKELEKIMDNLPEKEKDFLLRLYIYESRKTATD